MKIAQRTFLAASLSLCALLAQPRPQPGSDQLERQKYIKEHYTKHEFLIPMRDGVRLFTQVFTPKDASQTYPFLLNRTPYTV